MNKRFFLKATAALSAASLASKGTRPLTMAPMRA